MVVGNSPNESQFEISLCGIIEQDAEWILARQIGAGGSDRGKRVIDICALSPGKEFIDRARISAATIPPPLLNSPVGVATAIPESDVLGGLNEWQTDCIETGLQIGFLTREFHSGQPYIRQAVSYPDCWFSKLIGIENKPDLSTPGDLTAQLEFDVSISLFDHIILATETYVTEAHLNRIPQTVGVWRFDPESNERTVVREPMMLDSGQAGIEITQRLNDRADIYPITADEKRRARRDIAERTYGKGWRTYDPPACQSASVTAGGQIFCDHFESLIDPSQRCGPDCPGYAEDDPPVMNPDDLRDARTPWIKNPSGVERRQSGLSEFF
jgi:hypothetical protein